MRGIITAVAFLGALLGGVTPWAARPALACNAGAGFDPLADATIIVGGHITGWELGPPASIEGPPRDLAAVPLRITMAVEHAFKGQPPSSLVFLDYGSQLAAEHAAVRYPDLSVGVGGCSVFHADDPTGQYAVLGLTRRSDGQLVANRLLTFFLGDALHGAAYNQALARLAPLGPARLPAAGTGGVPGTTHASSRQTPLLTISPAVAASGEPTDVLVRGEGFEPHDTVLIEYFSRWAFDANIGGETARLAEVTASPEGRFTTTVRMPPLSVDAPLQFYIMAFPLSFQVRSREALLQAPKQVFTIAPIEDLPRVGTGLAVDRQSGTSTYLGAGFVGIGMLTAVWLIGLGRGRRSEQR